MFNFGLTPSEQAAEDRKDIRLSVLNTFGNSNLDKVFYQCAPNTMKKIDAIYNRNPQYEAALKQAQAESNMWHGRYVEAVSRYTDLLTAYADLAEAKNTTIDKSFEEYQNKAVDFANKNR